MTFAVAEINQRQDLLPNLTLGYHIRDSCDDIPVSIKNSLLLVNGQPDTARGSGCADVIRRPSPVIVGDAASGISMAVLRTLSSFSIPLVRRNLFILIVTFILLCFNITLFRIFMVNIYSLR